MYVEAFNIWHKEPESPEPPAAGPSGPSGQDFWQREPCQGPEKKNLPFRPHNEEQDQVEDLPRMTRIAPPPVEISFAVKYCFSGYLRLYLNQASWNVKYSAHGTSDFQ